MSFERLRNSANLYKCGPLLVPGSDYDVMAELARHPLTPREIALRTRLIRYDPAQVIGAIAHHRALMAFPVGGGAPPRLLGYLDHYRRPFVALFKYLEGELFRAAPAEAFGSGSMEIGVSDGAVSRLHFDGREIEFGSEYLWQRLTGGAHPHQRLLSTDLRRLPLSDGALKSVFLVHVIDDLSFDVAEAFRELARVLQPNGLLVFSTASDAYGSHTSFSGLVPMSHAAFERYTKIRYGGVQLLSREALAERLAMTGFSLVEYREFLSAQLSPAWELGMTVEMAGTKTMADWLPVRLQKRYRDAVLSRLAGAAAQFARRGLNAFLIARRV